MRGKLRSFGDDGDKKMSVIKAHLNGIYIIWYVVYIIKHILYKHYVLVKNN